jgi:hypothetical protein
VSGGLHASGQMGLSTDKGLFHAKRCFQIRENKNKKKTLDALHYIMYCYEFPFNLMRV